MCRKFVKKGGSKDVRQCENNVLNLYTLETGLDGEQYRINFNVHVFLAFVRQPIEICPKIVVVNNFCSAKTPHNHASSPQYRFYITKTQHTRLIAIIFGFRFVLSKCDMFVNNPMHAMCKLYMVFELTAS